MWRFLRAWLSGSARSTVVRVAWSLPTREYSSRSIAIEYSSSHGGLSQDQQTVLHRHGPAGRVGEDPIWFDGHAVLGREDLHRRALGQDLRHAALASGLQVLDNHEGHAAVGRHRTEELLQRFNPFGRSPDPDDVETCRRFLQFTVACHDLPRELAFPAAYHSGFLSLSLSLSLRHHSGVTTQSDFRGGPFTAPYSNRCGSRPQSRAVTNGVVLKRLFKRARE